MTKDKCLDKSNHSSDESLKNEIRNLNTFTDTNVPSYIISFSKKLDKSLDYYNAADMYPLLLKHVPDDVPEPTFNQWIYFYNICKYQQICNGILSGIRHNEQEIVKIKSKYLPDEVLGSEDQKVATNLDRVNKELHKQYREYANTIIKYTNDGLNRESRDKNVDKVSNRLMTIDDFNRVLRGEIRSTEPIPAEFRDIVD